MSLQLAWDLASPDHILTQSQPTSSSQPLPVRWTLHTDAHCLTPLVDVLYSFADVDPNTGAISLTDPYADEQVCYTHHDYYWHP